MKSKYPSTSRRDIPLYYELVGKILRFISHLLSHIYIPSTNSRVNTDQINSKIRALWQSAIELPDFFGGPRLLVLGNIRWPMEGGKYLQRNSLAQSLAQNLPSPQP